MNYLRILLCDDDEMILRQLRTYIQEFFHKNGLVQPEYVAYRNGEQLLEKEKEKSDIAFLDVEMPGKSGIHVGDQLMKRNPRIKVFIVTSFPDYLDEAMHFHVFRYLSKPINKNRLFANLKDALYQISIETVEVPVETKDGVQVCSADDIICIEATQRKTIVYTINGSLYCVKGIEFWTKKLEDLSCFYCPYRSFIINMKYVHSFDKTLIKLKHKDFEINPYLSRRKYTDFKNHFLLYWGSMR